MSVHRQGKGAVIRRLWLSAPIVLLTAACASQSDLDAVKAEAATAQQVANQAKTVAGQALDAAKAADAKAVAAQQAAQQAAAAAQSAAKSAADAQASADKMEQLTKKGMRK